MTSMTCWLDRRPEIVVTVPAGGMKAQDAPEFLGGYVFFVFCFPFQLPAFRIKPEPPRSGPSEALDPQFNDVIQEPASQQWTGRAGYTSILPALFQSRNICKDY